jgi:hypothetical protein
MARLYWLAGAAAIVFAAARIPYFGPTALAPVVAFAAGLLAAWWYGAATDATIGRAAAFGAIAGLGAFLRTIAAFALHGLAVGVDPTIHESVRAAEPGVAARIPLEWTTALGALTGALVGSLAGLIELAATALGAMVGGLLGGRAPSIRPDRQLQ